MCWANGGIITAYSTLNVVPSKMYDFIHCGLTLGGFRNPIFRKWRTINGVQVSVVAILTGAKTLWTAYAMTKVEPPVTTFDSKILCPTPIFWRMATISIPLKRENQQSFVINANVEMGVKSGPVGEGHHLGKTVCFPTLCVHWNLTTQTLHFIFNVI